MRHEAALRVCLAVVAVLFAARTASAQISPGPLSAAHASLDGPLNCTKCHAGGGGSMTTRCLSCHREIATLKQQNRGIHARDARGECQSCHPDHAGRDFALVKWPDGSAERFDHARVGWVLDGKHARVTCQKCHTSQFRVGSVAALGPKRTGPGFVGLETSCASCHEDVHSNTLGRTCESCHTAEGWSPASRFDHARSDYKLTGKHVDVACEKCHVAPVRRPGEIRHVAQFKPLQHADCSSCHRDPHAGRLTGTCASCHATTSFSTVDGRAFSHERTRYPLRGRHADVKCASCHAGYPGTIDRPSFATCAGCHSDPHAGKATLSGASADCAACHSINGFTPATFTVAQHARTAYPLQGKHASVSCSGCHVRRSLSGAAPSRGGRAGAVQAEVVMRPRTDGCEQCHADAHARQLAARADRGACASCHTVAAWKASTFGVREHAALRFPLTGRHAAAECASCHSASRRGLPPFPATRTLGKANVAFTLSEQTCDGCHRDPHGGRYPSTTASISGSCVACHDTRVFRPSTVNVEAHARFSFALEGAHRATPCAACHTPMRSGAGLGASLKLAPNATVVSYALSGATCATCHQSPHGPQFATRPDKGACQGCHDLNAWAPAARFDHEANGGFKLGQAHAKVACGKCHTNANAPSNTRVWKGVPRTCESCHRGTPPAAKGAA